MLTARRYGLSVKRALSHRTKFGKPTSRKRQYQMTIESLESRVVLSYAFSYTAPVATATGSAAVDSLVLEPLGGFLLYSVNGAAFSANWGGITVPLSPTLQVDVELSTGDGSSLQLGTPAGPASTFGSASLNAYIDAVNSSDTMTIDDSTGTELASSTEPYLINTGTPGAPTLYPITGPGFNFYRPAGTFNGGITVKGSPVNGDMYNVLSTGSSEPVAVMTAGTTSTVSIGLPSSPGGLETIAGIQGPIDIVAQPHSCAVTLNDSGDLSGQTWMLNNDDSVPTGSVAVTGSAITTYNPVDLSALTVNGGELGGFGAQSGQTNVFDVVDTSGFYPTSVLTEGLGGSSTAQVFASGDNMLGINCASPVSKVTLGSSIVAPLGMQGLNGTINVGANQVGYTNLYLDDSEDATGRTALLSNDGTNCQVTGLSPATINYYNVTMNYFEVDGGSGGNTFTVDGTPGDPDFSSGTYLYTGSGDNTVYVQATSLYHELFVNGEGGQDTVSIGYHGSVADILGQVSVDNMPSPPGFTDLTVDSSADNVSHDFSLMEVFGAEGLFGLAPAAIQYDTAALSSLTIDTSDFGTQIMNIDMSGGNPIPVVDSPGLTWNAGADATSALDTHILNISGELPSGPFASETHNAADPDVAGPLQYGSIDFTDSLGTNTSLSYTGLQPITDTTPVASYAFNDFGYPDQSFSATDGPVTSGFQTLEFASTPSPANFETTDIANKGSVTFNTPPAMAGVAGPGVTGVVNVPIAPTGLSNLTFNTPTGGDNTISFVNTPPGVVTSYFDGAGPNTTNVTGLGVAAGTVLFLNGGPATSTLNYDAGGEIPTVTRGLLPGEVLVSIPGAGTFDAVDYQQINITNAGPLTITPGPARTINAVAGYPLVDAIVGTFTLPITAILPALVGFPASDFTASIDWGDPSPDTATGTITQDTSNPSEYDITGTHTFRDEGPYTVANTVTFSGGTITTLVTGTPVLITYGPAGPTAGNPATALVTQDALTVTAFPIAGTEGIAIPAGPIATFIDAGGAAPVADYSASIAITNSSGFSLGFAAASITQNGTTAEFTVLAPAFTLPEEGAYQVVVSVTDTAGAPPVTASGTSTAVIVDAPLTAGPAVMVTANTGVAFTAVVGSFTDANPPPPVGSSTIADFMATIDWGDSPPTSTPGTISQPGGPGTAYIVSGSYTYAQSGDYTIAILVTDKGGSQVMLPGTVDVTDLPVTGATTPRITAIQGMKTGPIVLATFTDPNPLATTADVTATIDWGDGTPVGGPLALQQIGVTPLTSPSPGEPIFDVLGSHTYAVETSITPFLPLTFTIDVTTSGGVSTTLSSPLGGGVTVLDAPLFGENSYPVTGTAGISTGTVPIASFLDANTNATSAELNTLPGSTEVFWGDGSSTPLSAANYTASNSAGGVVFTIDAAHTYAQAAQYTISVNVTDEGGQTTSICATASIAPVHTTLLPLVQNAGGSVPPKGAVDSLAGSSTHTTAAHKSTTTHKAKPAVTVRHTVQQTRVHDAALRAIIVDTNPRRLHRNS